MEGRADRHEADGRGGQAGAGHLRGTWSADDCWNEFGDPFAQLFCYFSANLTKYIPANRPRDYVGEIFAYNTTAASLGDQFGLLGFADDNWVDGTQTHVFMFDAPEYRELGFGFTTTGIHEFGHHIGMSHPHDGYDSELELDFDPGGPFEFAWSGDESHTVMRYLALPTGSAGSTVTTHTGGRRRDTSTGRTPCSAISWRIRTRTVSDRCIRAADGRRPNRSTRSGTGIPRGSGGGAARPTRWWRWRRGRSAQRRRRWTRRGARSRVLSSRATDAASASRTTEYRESRCGELSATRRLRVETPPPRLSG